MNVDKQPVVALSSTAADDEEEEEEEVVAEVVVEVVVVCFSLPLKFLFLPRRLVVLVALSSLSLLLRFLGEKEELLSTEATIRIAGADKAHVNNLSLRVCIPPSFVDNTNPTS